MAERNCTERGREYARRPKFTLRGRRFKRPPEFGEARMGTRNPAWRGGISNEPYDLGFNDKLRKMIKCRDNHRCQLCGGIDLMLAVHHIDYNKKNSKPENLISLCMSCNAKVNANRGFWQQYFIERRTLCPSYL